MKVFFLISFVLMLLRSGFSQSDSKYCELYKTSIRQYNENAMFPIETDKFDNSQFQNFFLRFIDPYSIIFNTRDLTVFSEIEHSIHTDLETAYCINTDQLTELYIRNIEQTIETLKEIKPRELDFSQKDSIYVGRDPLLHNYRGNKHERCKRYLKTLIIQELIDSTTYFDSLRNDSELFRSIVDSIAIKKANDRVALLEEKVNSQNKSNENVYYAFINSLTLMFDVYSVAFSNEKFNSFKEHLSSYSQYFGFQLEKNSQGEIVIASLIPGSFAWRTGLLNSGDKVIKLEAENQKPILTSESLIEDITEYLEKISTEKLTLTIVKPNSNRIRVDLYRDKLENLENSVQSFILNGEIKTGYIMLPAFYTSWDTQDGYGCAQDLGRAIYYLKKENIQSLIIDLRDNSGGSIVEAIDLAGIFIDFGTLSVASDKNGELISIKDFNRGTFYSGPLAIMVNSNSASASEMVAAVLQDYNRAIIVGETTFGKATGQVLLPLDNGKSILKVTTDKYYRVTKSTYNKTGVDPDIFLPGNNSQKNIYDQSNTDSINKKVYYNALPAIPLDGLRQKSKARIAENIKFQKIKSINNLSLDNDLERGFVPLDFDSYYALIKQKEQIGLNLKDIYKLETNSFTIDLLPKDNELLKINSYYSAIINQNKEIIISDPYIEETFEILIDYVNHLKN